MKRDERDKTKRQREEERKAGGESRHSRAKPYKRERKKVDYASDTDDYEQR